MKSTQNKEIELSEKIGQLKLSFYIKKTRDEPVTIRHGLLKTKHMFKKYK